MATSGLYNPIHPPWHGLYGSPAGFHGYFSPLLSRSILQLVNTSGRFGMGSNSGFEILPEVFYWIEIGALDWPNQRPDASSFKPL